MNSMIKKWLFWASLTFLMFILVAYSYRDMRWRRIDLLRLGQEYNQFQKLKRDYVQRKTPKNCQDCAKKLEDLLRRHQLYQKVEYTKTEKEYIRISFKDMSQDEWFNLMKAINDLQDMEMVSSFMAQSKNGFINFMIDLRSI